MSVARPVIRALALPALAVLGGFLPSTAAAQLAVASSNESVLVLPPVPSAAADSAFAIQVGDAVRKKMEGKFRLKLRVVPKNKIAEALNNSGFPPDAILDDNGASQLARFVNVDAYVTGRVQRGDTPRLALRLVDARRSGLSGWVHVAGAAGENLDDFASTVVDSVDNQVKAAEQVRECYERRDRQEYGSARERADRAFRIYPNHPGASMCVATIMEAMKSSPDSMIVMLKRAVVGDSLLTRAWEMLARQYQAKGDTVQWANSLIKVLETNPTDMRMRLAAATLLIEGKQFSHAAQLIDEGLERSPGDPVASQLKARACFEGQMWGCAVEALGARYESETQLQTDSLYMQQLLAVIGAVNDTSKIAGWDSLPARARSYYRLKSDSLAMEKWTGTAVEKFPNSVTFWRMRAQALRGVGKTSDALMAFRRVAALDPKDFASRVQAAQLQTERAGPVIDSLAKLAADTIQLKANRATWENTVMALLAPADTFLDEAAKIENARLDSIVGGTVRQALAARRVTATDPVGARIQDSIRATVPDDKRVNLAVLYFQPATKLTQSKLRPDVATRWLENAIALDPKKQIYAQANFFLGLAYLYRIQGMDLQGFIARKDCRGMTELEEVVTKGKAAIQAGASVQPATAQQLTGVFTNLEKTPPQAKKAWNCR